MKLLNYKTMTLPRQGIPADARTSVPPGKHLFPGVPA